MSKIRLDKLRFKFISLDQRREEIWASFVNEKLPKALAEWKATLTLEQQKYLEQEIESEIIELEENPTKKLKDKNETTL